MFIECPYSKSVWEKVAAWSNRDSLRPVEWERTERLDDWFLRLPGTGTQAKGMRSMAILVMWELWKERNARIFQQKLRSEPPLFSWIQDEARNWTMAGAKPLAQIIPERQRTNEHHDHDVQNNRE